MYVAVSRETQMNEATVPGSNFPNIGMNDDKQTI